MSQPEPASVATNALHSSTVQYVQQALLVVIDPCLRPEPGKSGGYAPVFLRFRVSHGVGEVYVDAAVPFCVETLIVDVPGSFFICLDGAIFAKSYQNG